MGIISLPAWGALILTQAILELDEVTKTFGTGPTAVFAARQISFSLHAGRTLAIVGESGSGKTTCARIAMREYAPTSGRLLFKGKPVEEATSAELKSYRGSVQMIFQDPFASLNPAHTIGYHLMRPLKIHRSDLQKSDMTGEIEALLNRVKLDPKAIIQKYPHELSGGQRQRICIARALAVRPEIIVADEPTSMLDVSVRMGVLNLLNEMKVQLGLGLLYITHDIATARYVAENIAVMYAGRIVEWGPTAQVIDTPAHPYTRLLLSAVPDPQIRFDNLSGRIETERAQMVRGNMSSNEMKIANAGVDHYYLV